MVLALLLTSFIELWLESGVCSDSPFINSSRFSLYLKENWFFWKEVHILYQFYFTRTSESEGFPGGVMVKNLESSVLALDQEDSLE